MKPKFLNLDFGQYVDGTISFLISGSILKTAPKALSDLPK